MNYLSRHWYIIGFVTEKRLLKWHTLFIFYGPKYEDELEKNFTVKKINLDVSAFGGVFVCVCV